MMTNRLLLLCLMISVFASAQTEVSQARMQAIYEEVKTPYKFGLVVKPESETQKIDCPTVFRKGADWYMTYIVFDGRGYETWLARSEDLLHWTKLGRLLAHSTDTLLWDASQKAGYPSLVDTKWEGSYAWKKAKGAYWMSYFGGREKGYEAGLLSIGMAHTRKKPSKPQEWARLPLPVLTARDSAVRWWENKKLFKSTVIEDPARRTGYRYLMYYNANGDTAIDNKKTRWFERIGMAASNDMKHWVRYVQEPLVHHPVGITGDPYLQQIGDTWVMFYFGAFWQDRKGAFNRFAASDDLVHWTDWNGDNLIESSEPFDALYAHKSCVVKWKGVVYHFYNAVDKKEHRGIAVATSKDLGKSTLTY